MIKFFFLHLIVGKPIFIGSIDNNDNLHQSHNCKNNICDIRETLLILNSNLNKLAYKSRKNRVSKQKNLQKDNLSILNNQKSFNYDFDNKKHLKKEFITDQCKISENFNFHSNFADKKVDSNKIKVDNKLLQSDLTKNIFKKELDYRNKSAHGLYDAYIKTTIVQDTSSIKKDVEVDSTKKPDSNSKIYNLDDNCKKNEDIYIDDEVNPSGSQNKIHNNVILENKYNSFRDRMFIMETEKFKSVYDQQKLFTVFQSDVFMTFAQQDSFMHFFKIIESDMIKIIKFAYSFTPNKFLIYYLNEFNKKLDNIKRIERFLKISNQILLFDFQNNNFLIDEQVNFIKLLLSRTYKKILANNNYYKIFEKNHTIHYYTQKKELSFSELLNFLITSINNLDDKYLQKLCLLGLQNFFTNDAINNMPRFCNILNLLFTYIYKKIYHDIDWHEKLFKMLVVSPSSFKSNDFYLRLKNFIIETKDNEQTLRLYIGLNSDNIAKSIYYHKKLKKNLLAKDFILDFLILSLKVKCKIFGIYFIL